MKYLPSPSSGYQLRLLLLLVSPSVLSGSLVAFGTLLALAVPSRNFLEDSQPLFEFFYGSYGIVTAIESTRTGTTAMSSIFADAMAYNVAVLLFSTVVGFVVYLILQVINHLTSGVASPFAELKAAQPADRPRIRRAIAQRLAVQIVTLVCWCLYWFAFIVAIWPFSILAIRTGIGQLFALHAVWPILTGVLVFMLAAHLHIVFIRLLALRPRLFGNPELIYKEGHG